MRVKESQERRKWILPSVLLLILALAVGTLGWCRWVYLQIERYAGQDQAGAADAIAVFGAAEYDGRPSPVYRARLDHAETLYNRGIAPLIITLGGDGGDQFSEGAVGREYLMGEGIPESAIIAETHSRSTEESARRIAVIARTNGFRRLVVVSDGTHLFRIHESAPRTVSMCLHRRGPAFLLKAAHQRLSPSCTRNPELHGLASRSELSERRNSMESKSGERSD